MEREILMSPLEWIIFWFAIGAYSPLVIGAVRERDDKSQVFTTWFLYFLLDVITMDSSRNLDGNDIILFGFAIGSFIMMSILLFQKRIAWTWLETIISGLVILCIIAYYISGPFLTLIFGIMSECIVGVYLIIKTFMNPVVKYNLTGYIMFLITSLLAMLNAKDWSIREMGYPLCEAILCVLTIFPLIIKWRRERKMA